MRDLHANGVNIYALGIYDYINKKRLPNFNHGGGRSKDQDRVLLCLARKRLGIAGLEFFTEVRKYGCGVIAWAIYHPQKDAKSDCETEDKNKYL